MTLPFLFGRGFPEEAGSASEAEGAGAGTGTEGAATEPRVTRWLELATGGVEDGGGTRVSMEDGPRDEVLDSPNPGEPANREVGGRV